MEQIKINWTKKAESSLERIHNYISLDSIVYADRFIEALIIDTTNFFQIGIAKGRLVQEFENTPISFLREVIYRGYRVIYFHDRQSNIISILNVMNGRMDIQKAFNS